MKTFLWLWLVQLPSSLPVYTERSLVNAASQAGDRFAPNTILTLYGTNLSFGSGGVQMLRNGTPVDVFFVSPGQVNFLLPADTRPGTHTVQLAREGAGGPRIAIRVSEQAPEVFTTPANWLLATRADGSLITEERPARPGETIVFYGTGFGPVSATAQGSQPGINWLEFSREFAVLVNGESMGAVYYVGTAPGFKGLFQVNFTLPEGRIGEANPEVRVSARGDRSREGTRLWFQP